MYKYFTEEELKCKCGCDNAAMDPLFMEKMDTLRETCGFPFVVTSAYRCPEYNNKVSTTGLNGPHTTGKAIDIAANSHQKYKIIKNLDSSIKRFGIAKTFIHIDNLSAGEGFPEEVIWTY